MQLVDLLVPAHVVAGARATSRKRLLELLSRMLDEHGNPETERAIFDALCRRERLGSTALGHGVAIPHGRTPGITRPVGAFVRLAEPLAFDAPDGQPVDLVFALVVPEMATDQHLVLLADIAQRFGDTALIAALRRAQDDAELHALLVDWHEHTAAA